MNLDKPVHKSELRFLSPRELARMDSYVRLEDARRFARARIFLKRVLGDYEDADPAKLRFSYGKHGKPVFSKKQIHFSLSYRKNMALLALCRTHEIGVDIEQPRKLREFRAFTEFSFSGKEKKLIGPENKVDNDVLFTLWAFKEAFIKCTGTGLSADISKIDLSNFLKKPTHTVNNHGKYTICMLTVPSRFKAAVASKADRIQCLRFRWRS
jgi:4'-phosphopantetheinyl transferase